MAGDSHASAALTAEVVERDGRVSGPVVRPRNISHAMAGSIHEETTAVALGMRGALVTGRTLLVAFVPPLLTAFGPGWFERGSISMEFNDGVLDLEPVQAVLSTPPGAMHVQVEVWLQRPDSRVVACGSAAAGDPQVPTCLGAIDPLRYATGEFALVGEYVPGTPFPECTVTVSPNSAERWHQALPSLPWFVEAWGGSPWGGAIASPAALTTAFTSGCAEFRKQHPIAGVPVDGAIELRHIAGPVFVGRPYRLTSRVFGRGRSPRTEYFWYEAALDDEAGRRIAEMRMKLRWMPAPAADAAAAGRHA